VIRIGVVLALTAAHVIVCAWLPAGALPAWILGSHVTAKLLAAGGGLAAFAALQPGDYMRRFWASMGLAYFLLVVAEDPVAGAIAAGNARAALLVGAAALVAANLLSVLASSILALTFRKAGLEPTLAGVRLAAYVVAAVAAAGLVWTNVSSDLRDALAGGGVPSWASAISYVCDALTFVLLVPVVRYTLRLGRSKLGAPWWAFAASGLGWLLFSTVEKLPFLGDSRLLPEALRTAATLLAGLAGLYQRALVMQARGQLQLQLQQDRSV
jgi:hypothetical protein